MKMQEIINKERSNKLEKEMNEMRGSIVQVKESAE